MGRRSRDLLEVRERAVRMVLEIQREYDAGDADGLARERLALEPAALLWLAYSVQEIRGATA